jgi:hypothetical protein
MLSKLGWASLSVITITALASLLRSPAATPPTQVGQCSDTIIDEISTRLVDENNRSIPDSGTAVQLKNGVYLVSYDTVPEAVAAKQGDKVKVCLQSIPKDCPPGDDRGKIYSVLNYRTQQSFTLPDSSHMCGGA